MTTRRAAKQPNIVFVLIDDLGCCDLGCYGSSFYETPNLDKLAAGGLRFTDAYAASPVCSPTRASLMTGKVPARVGITQWIGGRDYGALCDVPYFYHLPKTEVSVAEALRRGGYQTWHVGKWHLGDQTHWPERHGFDINIAGCGWGRPKQGYFNPWGIPTLSDASYADGTYLTDALTDEAIRLIEGREENKPFFLNLWHYAVHTPIRAPAELVSKYQAKAKAMGLDQESATIEGELFSSASKQGQRLMRRTVQSDPTYAAMIENLDANIGRLLDKLEAENLTEQTLIVFLSDNGGLATSEGSPTCNAPMSEGKGWTREGGVRVCQIASWPGRIKPGECDVPSYTCDWYPTALAAAGLEPMPEQHADGIDLLPLLSDGIVPDRQAICFHYPHYSNQGDTPSGSIRAGDWKLIEHFDGGTGSVSLFNLRDDVSETRDLADEEPETTQRLRSLLHTHRKETGALIPRRNHRWPEQQAAASGVDAPDV